MSDYPTTISAAMALWEPLAAFAWTQHGSLGRGAVLIEEDDLTAGVVRPSYIPVAMVPRSDDFRPLLDRYDPEQEVMLLVRVKDGGEQLLALRADGERRPRPAVCARSREERA